LEELAGANVTLLGRQSQAQVETLMARCRAFVYAGLEDFGIAPVEAMAAGAPVIGLGHGGLLDTVRCAAKGCSKPTGVLFPEQSVESVMQAVQWFQQQQRLESFNAESIRSWAERFRPEAFAARFEASMRRSWADHQMRCAVAASDPAGVSGLFS
jgi:glycosyltransferase involved in cell wall biosynthesis